MAVQTWLQNKHGGKVVDEGIELEEFPPHLILAAFEKELKAVLAARTNIVRHRGNPEGKTKSNA